jgi:hypothetical protein
MLLLSAAFGIYDVVQVVDGYFIVLKIDLLSAFREVRVGREEVRERLNRLKIFVFGHGIFLSLL